MEFLETVLGLHADKLNEYQMAGRAFVLFFVSLILIRLAGIRMLGKQSSFDVLTSIMLGAIMGRAAVTNESFFGSILASTVLMLLHRLTAWITYRSKKAGKFFKGREFILMKEGKKNHANLYKTLITEEDILEAVRKDANMTSLDKVKEVYLERSGDISIIK